VPIKKSAKKALRKSHKQHARNISKKSELKTRIKLVEKLISEGKLEEAKKACAQLSSRLDTAVSKGAVHKNTASRKKSRLMKKINQTGK